MGRRRSCRFQGHQTLALCLAAPGLARSAGFGFVRARGARCERPATAVRALPLELLALPPLETYTSKGVQPAPVPQLPPGKQTIFDGTPLLQTDTQEPASGLLDQFAQRLGAEFQVLDGISALLLMLALGLGLLDTRRRWLSYASEQLTWWLYQAMPGDKVLPARLAPGSAFEVERAEASWPQMRQLVKYLTTARVPDRLRAAAAADAAREVPELRPLAEVVLEACAAALPRETDPLPAIDGEWECACDYFRNGNVIFVPMRIRGSSGDYIADGGRHQLLDIARRREGSLVVADFRWKNFAGASGVGKWLVSARGDFVAGTWFQDDVDEGPWSWYGRRKPTLGNPLPREQTPAAEEPVPDLGPAAIEAARAATKPAAAPAAREALALAWERVAPQQPSGTGGDLAPSAVLRRRWMAAGLELRTVLGLSVGLASETQRLAGQAVALLLLSLLSVLLARALTLALGNAVDAATWSFFLASYAVVLDFVVRKDEGAAESQSLRGKLLQRLRSWAEAGGLRRDGATPREEVLRAVRRVLAPDVSELSDSEIEELLKVWNPDLKRQVLRSSRLSKGALITYENMSIVEGKEPRSIW